MSKTLSELASENIIDSRDIIARFEELKDEKESLESDVEEAKDAVSTAHDDRESNDNAETEKAHHDAMDNENECRKALADWLVENKEEFDALESIVDECSGYGDFSHSETLISEEYFPTYAEELASDIGAIDRNANWPLNHIDWNAAADELKADYTTAEIEGNTFYFRA